MDKKNTDIEVLRTLAIVFVFLAHIPGILSPDSFYWKIFNISRFGSGVDLFFCVSGFIVTRSLLSKNMHLMSFNDFRHEAKLFYIKRAWRLLPAAFFWIAVSILLAHLLKSTGAFISFRAMLKSAFFAATQTQNIFFMTCRDHGGCGNLGIYWSLSLENQFYLLLPLILYFFNNKKLCFFMLFVFIIQFFLPRTLDNHTPVAWPIRTDAISLGVIMAVISTKDLHNKIKPKILDNSFILGLTFVILTFLLAVFTKPEPIVFFQVGLTALISGIFVYIASYNNNYFSGNRIVRSFCEYIGSRSYSLYLTHVIALATTRGFFITHNPDYSAMGTFVRLCFFFSLTFLLTEFSYRCIENKFRYSWKKKTTIDG
ncbi:acyltransferase family protein [Erwinia sorbitola]|uniref:Acyltransferase family protein n=1 Tax=Erwinia sorbitola TaxID=2681984 RepID=A0A6I6EN42_9GAMM|nr:acyltransferase [Erwinia sorbitola]QGU88091.1 acyltransferase family protein [Erwinia sorbitola]